MLVIEIIIIINSNQAGVGYYLHREGPNLGKSVTLDSDQPLQANHLAAMASRLSPVSRTSAVTKPRQLAPTVGPAHGGVEFLEGALPGIEGYAIGRMTKSRRGKLYIDDAGWGPEADSIEFGYRVPFGKIHVFIGVIGGSDFEPDVAADSVEAARRVTPRRVTSRQTSTFVGFIGGVTQELDPATNAVSGDTTRLSTLMASHQLEKPESILPLFDERLGGYSDDEICPESYGSTSSRERSSWLATRTSLATMHRELGHRYID